MTDIPQTVMWHSTGTYTFHQRHHLTESEPAIASVTYGSRTGISAARGESDNRRLDTGVIDKRPDIAEAATDDLAAMPVESIP